MGGLHTAEAVESGPYRDSRIRLRLAAQYCIALGNRHSESLGRIELKINIMEIAELADSELAATVMPIDPVHIDKICTLPFHHRDPFDRLLIAQALMLQASIISRDEGFDAYGVTRAW